MSIMIIKKGQFSDRVTLSPVFLTELSAKRAGYDIKRLRKPIKYHFENGFVVKERYRPDLNDYFRIEVLEKKFTIKNIDVYVEDFIHLLEFEPIK